MTYRRSKNEFERNGNLQLYLSTVLFALERQMNGQNDYPVYTIFCHESSFIVKLENLLGKELGNFHVRQLEVRKFFNRAFELK